MNLHTPLGYFSLGDSHEARVVDGGALEVTDSDGKVTLIGAGYWVAVTHNNSRFDKHDMYVDTEG